MLGRIVLFHPGDCPGLWNGKVAGRLGSSGRELWLFESPERDRDGDDVLPGWETVDVSEDGADDETASTEDTVIIASLATRSRSCGRRWVGTCTAIDGRDAQPFGIPHWRLKGSAICR